MYVCSLPGRLCVLCVPAAANVNNVSCFMCVYFLHSIPVGKSQPNAVCCVMFGFVRKMYMTVCNKIMINFSIMVKR